MNRPPEAGERGVRKEPGPIRSAGVTPAAQLSENPAYPEQPAE
jgi:hypothetical protein